METEVHRTKNEDDKMRGKTVEDAVKRMEQTRPTPTQEENDKAAMGEHVEKHEPDGSPEEKQPEALTAEKQKEARAKSAQQQEESKPTLTQEENDKHAMGEHTDEHEADGSPEQPAGATDKKDAQAKPAGARYETRQARPARTTRLEAEKPAG